MRVSTTLRYDESDYSLQYARKLKRESMTYVDCGDVSHEPVQLLTCTPPAINKSGGIKIHNKLT